MEAIMTTTPLAETLALDRSTEAAVAGLGIVRGALAEVRIGNAEFHAYLA
jgi:hypothetical protein